MCSLISTGSCMNREKLEAGAISINLRDGMSVIRVSRTLDGFMLGDGAASLALLRCLGRNRHPLEQSRTRHEAAVDT
jgi:hypothetical protein